jgi:hypothetical protein
VIFCYIFLYSNYCHTLFLLLLLSAMLAGSAQNEPLYSCFIIFRCIYKMKNRNVTLGWVIYDVRRRHAFILRNFFYFMLYCNLLGILFYILFYYTFYFIFIYIRILFYQGNSSPAAIDKVLLSYPFQWSCLATLVAWSKEMPRSRSKNRALNRVKLFSWPHVFFFSRELCFYHARCWGLHYKFVL